MVVDFVGKKKKTTKVGHTGTLDPMAEGVLVLGINQGTKIIDLLISNEKEYVAEVILGQKSDTLDITGKIEEVAVPKNYTCEEIKTVLHSFLGTYLQEVPLYSAIHVEGKRLYEYARKNQKISLPKRMVEIKEIELIGEPERIDNHETFRFRVVVSKGTYIRSLIRDIGKSLGTEAIMKSLLRTRQGSFRIEDAYPLEQIDENTPLIKMKDALDALSEYDKIVVDENLKEKIKDGPILPKEGTSSYTFLYDQEGTLLAIYQPYAKDQTKMKPWKVFPKEEE